MDQNWLVFIFKFLYKEEQEKEYSFVIKCRELLNAGQKAEDIKIRRRFLFLQKKTVQLNYLVWYLKPG